MTTLGTIRCPLIRHGGARYEPCMININSSPHPCWTWISPSPLHSARGRSAKTAMQHTIAQGSIGYDFIFSHATRGVTLCWSQLLCVRCGVSVREGQARNELSSLRGGISSLVNSFIRLSNHSFVYFVVHLFKYHPRHLATRIGSRFMQIVG